MKTKVNFFRYLVITLIIICIVGPISFSLGVTAEQSGLTPESGAISRIKEIYDSLVTGDKGADTAGSWGDWGAMWNRIYSATQYPVVDYSFQQYSERDDFAGTYYTGLGPEDYQMEESTWTDASANGSTVWKDDRTGVYWGPDRGVLTTNTFTELSLNTCDFYDETLYPERGDYPGVPGSENVDADCGNAINYCATLDHGGRTDWYLPSQKELMQAYMDGMYNKAGTTPTEAASFTYGTGASAGYPFWSSSEVSNYTTGAWRVRLTVGTTDLNVKTSTFAVRCVSRD